LRERAQRLDVGESGLLVLDWFNGNRSVLCDSELSGMVLGLKLTTRPEEIYRAMLEGVAFGARMIIENYTDNGISIGRACATGGIALKDELLMQIMSDVTGLTIEVADCPQACALGSAMYGAVAGGLCEDMSEAVKRMSRPAVKSYYPNEKNHTAYNKLYAEYKTLHDYFGRGENDVMKRLLQK
jgi:L-ribulokinase